MPKFNTDEIASLLHIHEKAMGHPRLNNIRDAAMDRLNEINGDIGSNAEGGVMGSGQHIKAAAVGATAADASKTENIGIMNPGVQVVRRTAATDADDPSRKGSG